ncbi:hypothetical protein [Phaeodactylibacter sp.]|uniref:hypothetical protein n=1 Tax=Phaeodactylibacter sp. TaxID=1940289 RepID=UPI0025FF3EB2|nr:hypothetical protein [Phaeodactylibacter sp.]MCI4649612.1 hypothetical protein [Phaeodactylibacter sp.]MCI5093094.1 hypothetical protein [Phaeodactylibacter sp.]
MRNKWLFLILLTCCMTRLTAQQDLFVVLDVSSSNGLTYSQEGGNERRVFAGTTVKAPGRLRLLQGVSAVIVFEDTRTTLKGPAMYDLEQLGADIRSQNSSTFLSRFWSFISNAIKDTDTPQQVEQSHRRYLTNARAGVSGFGSPSYSIEAPLYLTGLLTHPEVTFRWDSVAHPSGYRFELRKEGAAEPILAATLSDEQFTTDLRQLRFEGNAPAYWQVSALQTDSSWLQSAPFPILYDEAALQNFDTQLEADGDFQSLSEPVQPIYRLYELEEAGLFQAAYCTYAAQLQSDAPSAVDRQLFISFLLRMNALEEAQTLMK